jgi:hypothetical protein
MDAGIERLSEDEHAYALALEGRPVAHVWWDADPLRPGSVGWYVRDLRTPGHVRCLDVGAELIEALAGQHASDPDAWQRAADDTAQASVPDALARARELVLEGPGERYQIQVLGLEPGALAEALPSLRQTTRGDREILTGRLTPLELGVTLATVRKLGGTTSSVLRLDWSD